MIENINLIRKIAWSFHKTTGCDWDDLFQEGMIAYFNALGTHDICRGALSTHVWHCVSSHLKNYVKKEREFSFPLMDLSEVQRLSITGTPLWESLSEKAQKALNIIIDNPEKFVALPPVLAEQLLRKILFENRWTLKEVRETIKEFKYVCS
jgi:hypothetical protein